jgi:hypothetical protein
MQQVHGAVTHVERRVVVDQHVWWCDHHLAPVRQGLDPAGDPIIEPWALVGGQMRGHPAVAIDRRIDAGPATKSRVPQQWS